MEPPSTTQTQNINEQFLAEAVPVGLPWRILLFAILVFAFTVFGYLGLHFGYSNYLDKQSADLDKRLDGLGKQLSPEERDKFVSFYSQLVNLRKVFGEHIYPSNILSFLERNVAADVYFSRLEGDLTTATVKLSGFGSSLDALAGQMAIFESSPEVSSVVLDETKIVQGGSGVNFTMMVNFKPDFLKNTPL